MKYPKLWHNSSAVGEALVRSLQRIDTPFLSAHAPGIEANKMNRFSEVKSGEDIRFIANGSVTREGEESFRLIGSYLLSGFRRVAGYFYRWYVGRRMLWAATWSEYVRTDSVTYAGNVAPTSWATMRSNVWMSVGRAESTHVLAEVEGEAVERFVRTGDITYRRNMEPTPVANGKDAAVCLFLASGDGRTDEAGWPVATPYCIRLDIKTNTSSQQWLPVPETPQRRIGNCQRPYVVYAGDGLVLALVFSSWAYSSDHNVLPDGAALLFVSTDYGQSWSVQEVTEGFLKDLPSDEGFHPKKAVARKSAPPPAPNGGVWEPPLEEDFWSIERVPSTEGWPGNGGLPEGDGYSTTRKVTRNVTEISPGVWTCDVEEDFVYPYSVPNTGHDWHDDHLWTFTGIMWSLRNYDPPRGPALAYIGNGQVLFSASFRYMTSRGAGPLYRHRLYRLSQSGMEPIHEFRTDTVYDCCVQDIKYLGNDTVMALNRHYESVSQEVMSLMVSFDRGQTWSQRSLPQFQGNGKLLNYGYLTVIRPLNEDGEGSRVAIIVFEEDEMRYSTYATDDAGLTWTRKGTVARTEAMPELNNESFKKLHYIGTHARPAPFDPAFPDLLET